VEVRVEAIRQSEAHPFGDLKITVHIPKSQLFARGLQSVRVLARFPSCRWRGFRGVGQRHVQIILSLCYP
jgi:hypothetical protein